MPVISLFGIALLGSVVQFAVATPAPEWEGALPGLYYIPIVIAAINLGMRAALGLALASGICYAIASAAGSGDPWIRPLSETILFVGVGVAAAKMARIHETFAARLAHTKGPGDFNIETAFQGARSTQQVPGFGQIVAGLIRRFRTPVSSIEGAVSLLEDFPDDRREEFLRIIRKESHQLDAALSDILEFTQPRTPRLRKVNLHEILDRVIEQAGPKDHGRFFLFKKEAPHDLPQLSCDPDMIAQALLAIARNGIQATPGGGQIILGVRVEQGNFIISVKDHGRGIPPDIADRIFDPFFTTRENGLGLGLTVARQTVVAHGGTITLEDGTEKGACVSVVLPLHPSQSHEHGPHTGG